MPRVPEFRRVTSSTLPEQVAEQIRELITTGELKPGDQLPSERRLAERLGVGRPAVREALRELKTEGLLVAGRGRRGTTVAALPAPQLAEPFTHLARGEGRHAFELMELRSAVEVQAAGLAARRATREDLHLLAETLAAPPDQDPMEADIAFHAAVAAGTHNPLFRQISRELVDMLHQHMPVILQVVYEQPGGLLAIRQQHEAVLQAIRQGDESGARDAMRSHLDHVTRSLARAAGARYTFRLVIADLDGTLLRGPREISERTKAAIHGALEAGLEVVLASARPPRSMRRYHEELRLTSPVIACNGALLWDLLGGRPLARAPLPHDTAVEIAEVGRSLAAIVNVESNDEWFADQLTDRILENIRRYGLTPPQGVGMVDEIIRSTRPLDKIFLDLRELDPYRMTAARAAVIGYFTTKATITETVPGLVDLVSPEASKAILAQQLARSFDISAEQVMAIGDHENDVPLLRWAGLGVAMGNAVPAAKAAADIITSSNLRDGAAEAIERWVLGRET